MQGKIISYSYKKKKEKALETNLVQKIKALEAGPAASQENHLSELRKVKLKFNKSQKNSISAAEITLIEL